MTSRGELSTGGDRSQRIGPEVLAEAEHQTVIGWLRCRAFRCGFGLVLIWVSVIASGSRDALLGQNNVPSANEQPNPQPLAAIQIESHLGSKVLTQLNLVPWLPLSLPGLSVSPLDSQNGSLHPRSLTSGDISGDGLPDLISGFSALEGGQISVHLANRESLYPQSPGAYQRIREGTFKEPFFQAQPLIFELPISPDFLLAGDFDGDLHADVLIGSRDEAAIYLLSNDGQGGLIPPKIRPLPGRPTSLISGEINRRDGVTDFVVAVTGETPDGSTAHQLLVFEHPEGAWQTPDPEVLPMDEAASSLSLALVDPDGWVDVAVAHGNQVTIFHGRDRRLTGEPKIQLAVPPAESSVFSFAWQAVAVQAADLSGDTSRELAVLLAGGQLEVLTWDRERIRQQTVLTADGDQGIRAGLESETLGAAQLLAVRMTGQEKEDLVLLDRARSAQLLFVRSDQIETQGAGRQPMGRVELLSFFQPRAVVPMRLNFDGSTDLIFLSDQAPYLAAITTGLGASFTITSSGEEDDGDLTDNKCAAEPCVEGNCTGPCSWLGAVKQANASGGATITFAVDRVVQPAGGMAIPDINVRVEILGDPNDRPKFISEICTSAFFGVGLLKLNGAESVVRNIEVIGDSVRLRGAGSTVEGSRLALQPLDEIFFLDCPKGLISDAADNTIGGAAAEARNLIAADGLSVLNVGAQVENNWVGLDESGQVAIENQGLSVQGSGHQIKNNVISGVQGLGFFGTPLAAIGVSCSGCAIQGNRVGTNHDGSQLLGNQGWGVLVSSEEGEATNTIGGTLPGLGNIVAGTRAHPDSEFEAFQTGSGIVTLGGLVQGNRIGTDATGTKSGFGNETNGVFVFPGAEVPNLLIGGLVQGAANLISGNGGHGVKLGVLLTGDPVRIQGNYIGIELPASGTSLDPEQARRLPNEKAGVEIGSNGHLVGGEDDRAGNTIAFNRQGGVRIHVGNVPEGAIVPPPTRNTIIGNRMFRNGTDDPEEIVLGIDLGADGITANDPGDPGNPDANPPVSPSLPDDDNGPNNLLNFPVVSFADCSPETELCSSAEIDVSPLPAGTFRIEVFENGGCDPSGHGEGEKRIGFLNATVDGSADPPPLLLALDPSLDPSEVVLTSTATDSDGNTSEFSACAGVTEIVVNSREDDPLKEDSLICDTGDQAFKERTGEVECTLRAAIELANKRVGQDTISFDIQEGSVPYLIQPESALPEISTPMVIDATTQQGFAASSAARGALFGWKTDLVTPATETCPLASPVVQIEGAQAGEETSGLTVTGGNTSILGLAIVSFTANGIQLKGGGNNIVDLNYLGTDGFEDLGNTERGLFIEESDGNRVGLVDDPLAILAGCLPRNVISGNRFQGVYVVRSEENRIEGNQIGTDTFGPTALPNSNGVAVFDSTRTTIRGNLISGNQRNGVQIVSSINGLSFDNSVVANMIGTDLSGEFPLGNTDAGVEIQNSSDNKITGNLISANEDRGIGIVGKQSTGNRVRLNFIGTDRSGGCEFDNGACPLGNGANFSSGPTAGGIVLWAGASSNDIGGETAGDRNIISGNHGPGVRLWLADTSANVIGANFIGFDALGNSLGNTGSGVEIEEATGTVVGGPNDGAQELFPGNRIARNGLGGISIENGSSTLVLGNLIQSNARDGLLMINAVDSFIGGANNEDDRIVSGNIFVDNGEFGVRIIGEDSFNNTVLN